MAEFFIFKVSGVRKPFDNLSPYNGKKIVRFINDKILFTRMTILRQEPLDIAHVARLYESPYNQSTSKERTNWNYHAIPFFDDAIATLWDLECRPGSTCDRNELKREAIIAERACYIKESPVIAIYNPGSDEKVVGGIWIDDPLNTKSRPDKRIKGASFRMKLLREHRQIAHPLFDLFRTIAERTGYDFLKAEWGPRDEIDDPMHFFQKKGFFTKYDITDGGGFAVLDIKGKNLDPEYLISLTANRKLRFPKISESTRTFHNI